LDSEALSVFSDAEPDDFSDAPPDDQSAFSCSLFPLSFRA